MSIGIGSTWDEDYRSEQPLNEIFLIEKGWIDPLENRNADGYEPFGFKLTEFEAEILCKLHGYWTKEDCWSVAYYPNGRMPKYRYKKINRC